jgi:hypothetical protein
MLLPTVNVMALLANPTDTSSAILSNNTMSVARALGLELHVLNASSDGMSAFDPKRTWPGPLGLKLCGSLDEAQSRKLVLVLLLASGATLLIR